MPGYYDRMPYDRTGQEGYRTSGGLDRDGLSYGGSANGSRFRGTEGYTTSTGSYGAMGGGGYQSRPSYSTGSGYSTSQGYTSTQASAQGQGYFSASSSLGTSSSYGSVGSRYDAGSSSYSGSGSSTYDAASGHGASGYRSGVSPWQGSMSASTSGVGGGRNVQEGMLPTPRSSSMGGYMQGGGGRSGNVDIAGAVNQLQQMGNPESKLALNILSAVLGKTDENTGGDWSGAPPSKMRRMDWDEGHGMRRGQALSSAMQSPPMRKYPQRDEYQPHRVWDSEPPQLAMASRPLTSGGPPKMGNDRRMARGRRGGRNINIKESKAPAKDQSRGRREATGADKTADGQRGKISEGGSSASSGPKQSGGTGTDNPRTGSGPSGGNAPRPPHQDIPKEALVCHMCNLTEFNTVGGYIRHLQTREHIDSASAYHNQGAAILQLLRSEARLAVRRAIVKTKRGGKEQNLMYCSKCQCRVPGSLDDHYKSIEHILVNQYLKVKCCGKLFNDRGELEMHRLGLEHLRVQYNLKKTQDEEQKKVEEGEEEPEGGITEADALEMFKNAAEEHKARNGQEVFTVDTLPAYEPTKPVGMHLLGIRSHYRCKVCPNKMRLETEHQVLKHFRSIDHYNHLFDFIIQQQIEKRKKKMEKTMEKATELINRTKNENKGMDGKEEEDKKKEDETTINTEENTEASKDKAQTSKDEADASKEEEEADKSKEDLEMKEEEEEEPDLEAIGEDIAVDIGEDIELLEDPTIEQEEEHNSDAEAAEDTEKAAEEEEAMETEEQGDDDEDKEVEDEDVNGDETRDQDEELDFEEDPNSELIGEEEEEEQEEGHDEQEEEEQEHQEEEDEEEEHQEEEEEDEEHQEHEEEELEHHEQEEENVDEEEEEEEEES